MVFLEHKPIHLLVKRMFPRFVSENYSQMILFFEKILAYMEQEGQPYNSIAHLLEYNDVDSTTEHFNAAFKNQYLQNFPDSLTADIDLIIKNIRSFYLSRGTEESYRFLFSALFNAIVNFKYPKFNILKCSDGLWFTPQYIVLTDAVNNIPPQLSGGSNYNIAGLIDKFITGTTSGAVAFVDNEITLSAQGLTYGGSGAVKAISIVEKEGLFIPGEQILIGDTLIDNGDFSAGTNNWSIFPALDSGIFTINNQLVLKQALGNIKNKYIYQSIAIEEDTQYWLRYSMIEADSPETKITVGYNPGTNEIYDSGNLGTTSVLQTVLLNATSIGKSAFYVSIFNQMPDANDSVTYDGISLIKEDTSNTPLLFVANIAAESGILSGISQWKDVRGFLSEGDKINDKEIVLQDNFFYQDFSYELKSTISSNVFDSIIKDLLHPAGMKMFSQLLATDELTFFSLRESSYTDLVFANTNPDTITRITSGIPFNILFRKGDIITINTSSITNEGEGQYLVDNVTATVITLAANENLVIADLTGIIVQISSSLGIIDLFGTDAQIVYDYTRQLDFDFNSTQEFYPNTEIDYIMKLGFGKTWSDAESSREQNEIIINDWSSIVIGDFETFATSRFGFIDSAELIIS